MDQITYGVFDLYVVLGSRGDEPVVRLWCAGWEQRVAFLDDRLAWVDDGPLVDAAVEWAYCHLSRSHGAVPIGVLADEIGWSRRHPISRFGQGSLPSRSRGCCASKG